MSTFSQLPAGQLGQAVQNLNNTIKGNRLGIEVKGNAPIFQSGTQNYYNLADLGLPQFQYADFIINAFGRTAKVIPNIFRMMGINDMPINSRTLVIERGRELDYRFEVKSTITANGTGLSEVEIEVYGPDRSNAEWFNVNEVLEFSSGRHFIITEVGVHTTGFPKIKITPKDGVFDLRVVNNQCTDTPTNTGFISYDLSYVTDYDPSNYKQRIVNSDQLEYYLMEKTSPFVRDGRFMQDVIGTSVRLPLQTATMNLSVGNETVPVNVYVAERELQDFYRHQKRVGTGMLYESGNFNPNIEMQSGSGLIPQIGPDKRLAITGNLYRDPLGFMRELVQEVAYNNPYCSEELVALCGTASYEKLVEQSRDRVTTYMQSPKDRSIDEIVNGYNAGTYFTTYVHSTGKHVRIINMDELVYPENSPRPSPENSSWGVRAHDIIVLDPGEVKNVDIKSGEVVSTRAKKIQTFVRPEFAYQEVYQEGIIDRDGRNKQGPVISFNTGVQGLRKSEFAVALLDEKSAVYASYMNS